jgi:endo-1,4-beta-xylanase
VNRRQFLAGTAGFLASSALRVHASDATLAEAARAKNMDFGCAVTSQHLAADSNYATLVVQQASMLVGEGEMKRGTIQPAADRFDFVGADKIMQFAERNNQRVRGHTLVWYQANPKWLPDALSQAESMQDKEKLLTGYIETVVGRYKGRMHSWDVVNEVVDPGDWRWDGMRAKSIWYQAFGEDYIPLAFQAAKSVDPNAMLYLNENNIESSVRWNESRRTAVLKLLDRLKSKDVPIDGFGIQGHLKPFRDTFDEKVFADFLKKLEGFGLKIMITEFDIADKGGPADPVKRDAEVAAITKSFLDVAVSNRAVTGVLTWGITDKYSWLSSFPDYKWPDGQLARGLPFDSNFRIKPMGEEIRNAFELASAR